MNQNTKHADAGKAGHLKTLAVCVGLVGGMTGLAYASVPLYQLFCQVTGYGGTTQVAESVDGVPVLDREVKVRFDANSNGLHWNFKPQSREVTVRFGEKVQINYFAENLSDEPLVGMATFNVTPQAAGAYFNKIECFCFTDTQVAPGEKLEMPVIFFVDPEAVNEPELEGLTAITLSYTFFPSDEEPQANSQAKLDLGAGGLQ